jgi:hypothetical protein
MAAEEGDARRRKRLTLIVAGVLFALFGLALVLPILAVVSESEVHLGAAVVSAEVYDEPTGTAPFLFQRQLEGPVVITNILDSAAPPLLPWSAGREVQFSCVGWTYRAVVMYPGAHGRETNLLLDKWKVR